jgi:hypothetical protein
MVGKNVKLNFILGRLQKNLFLKLGALQSIISEL